MAGTEGTRLVVLRGNSAPGKSSIAADRPGAANIRLIDLTARNALDAGYHVVVEQNRPGGFAG
jgi:predicted kinase